MRLVVYVWKTDKGWNGQTKHNGDFIIVRGRPTKQGVVRSFSGRFMGRGSGRPYSKIEYMYQKPDNDSVYVLRDSDESEPVQPKAVDIPSENTKGQFLYKREGDKLIIYQKVLVDKFPLA